MSSTTGMWPVAEHLRPKPREDAHWALHYVRRGPPEPGQGGWLVRVIDDYDQQWPVEGEA